MAKSIPDGWDVELTFAEHGKQAIEILTSGGIQVMFLDLNMPVMDGEEFLDRAREEDFTNAPIVMMTTENKPEKIQLAIEKGVSEFIMKPFTDDVLFGKIEMVTGVSHAV